MRWSQNGKGPGAGDFRNDRHSPHMDPGGVFPPYPHRQTRVRNGVTPCVLSGWDRQTGAGASRMAYGEGSSQKPMPPGKPEDMLTDSRLIEV
jgi:hypothetical protein